MNYIFNRVKDASDVVKNEEITRARDQIEKSLVSMMSKIIADGDKNKKPIELGVNSIKSFATCYEQLRDCEKSMVAAGY